MAEFQEIAHSGGRIEFNHETGVTFSHYNPVPCSMFQVCISYQGKLLDFVPIIGIGEPVLYPQSSIFAFVISDKEGMFGRICPECKCYFRMDRPTRFMFCPYCKIKANNVKFTTDNQKQFLSSYCSTLFTAMKEKRNVTIDLDKQADDLSNNTAKWRYREETQQTLHRCEKCRARFDILGEYGCCPSCGKLNALKILNGKLDGFINDVTQHPDEVLKKVVSEFEAMGKDLRSYLIHLPTTPQRKKEVERLSFQRVIDASNNLFEWYGVNLFKGINDADKNFINLMFQRRHLLTHNGGRVDQKYLDNTKDNTVRLNQTINVTEEEVRKLIELIRVCANNFLERVESIK